MSTQQNLQGQNTQDLPQQPQETESPSQEGDQQTNAPNSQGGNSKDGKTVTSSGKQILIQLPKSKSIELKKDGKPITIVQNNPVQKPPERTPDKPIEEKTSISIERRAPIKKLEIIQQKKWKDFDSLLKEWNSLDKTDFNIRSKGYIILKNYVFETKQGLQSSPRQFRDRQSQSRGKRPPVSHSPSVTFVELNSKRFTSTQLEKNIGEWDETSDEAFKININQILNRLTPRNMEQSLREISEQISIISKSPPLESNKNFTPKDRESFVVKTLVDKATKEQSFSDLYAQFANRTSAELKSKIVEKNVLEVNECILNKVEDEESSLLTNGSTKFFASLAVVGLITDQDLYEFMNSLLEELKSQEMPQAYHVEMLNSLYMNITPEVSNRIDALFDYDICEIIRNVMNMPNLKKRLYFLIYDIIERREKMRDDQKDAQKTAGNAQNEQASKENMSKVRGAFSSYMESYTLPDIDLQSRNFFYAAMDIFPDQSKVFFEFCQFITETLKSMHARENDNTRVLIDRCRRFREQSIEKECPNIWINISTLINMMLLESLIYLDKATEIHKEFPEPTWDFNNSMKWYLYDYYDWSKTIHVNSKWPLEFYDALRLPEAINNLNHNKFHMSKLICVALVRTLYQKFKDNDTVNFHTFAKWKKQLALAAERYYDTFKLEMEVLLNDFEMNKTVDQFIDYCKKET